MNISQTQRQIALIIGLILVSVLVYLDFIGGLSKQVDQSATQLKQTQHRLKIMQTQFKTLGLTQGLPLKGSLLTQLNQLRTQYNLNQSLSRIEIKKNTAIITLKSANYQAVMKFLSNSAQYGVVVEKARLTKADTGLVDGKVTLVHQ